MTPDQIPEKTDPPYPRHLIVRWCVQEARKDYDAFLRLIDKNSFPFRNTDLLMTMRRGFLLQRLAEKGIVNPKS